jgi:signal transduction histidine kinase
VSHELQSPVASIMTDVNLILGGYLGDVPTGQRQKLEGALRKGELLLSIVRDYLNLARVDAGELRGNFRDVRDFTGQIIEPAIDVVRGAIEERGQAVHRDLASDVPPIRCDPELLRIAVQNYVGNASKYGDDGGEIRITVKRAGARLRVAVWNSGQGYPPDQQGQLFRRFSRLDNPELRDRKGTGVGLYSTARIVAVHGGRVGAATEPGVGAEFWLEVPLRGPGRSG